MTAAALKLGEESLAKWQRRDPVWGGAGFLTLLDPLAIPAQCLVPPFPGPRSGASGSHRGAVIPKDQAYQGQANTLRDHQRQGHKTQNCGFSSSDLTCYVTSKSQPHPSS